MLSLVEIYNLKCYLDELKQVGKVHKWFHYDDDCDGILFSFFPDMVKIYRPHHHNSSKLNIYKIPYINKIGP